MSLTTEQQVLGEQRLANDKKSAVVAYLLWFFLGGFGAHRFYLGRAGSGAAILVLFILGWITLAAMIGIPMLIVVGVWLLVDAALIPGMIEQLTRDARARIGGEISAMSVRA